MSKMSTYEDTQGTASIKNRDKLLSYDFDIGSLLFKNGNFSKSLHHIRKASVLFLENQHFAGYFSCYNIMLQIFTEFGDKEQILLLQTQAQRYCKYYNISNITRMLTCSAYYYIYVEKDLKRAKKDLDKALNLVFESYEKSKQEDQILNQITVRFEIINCLYFYSIYYFNIKEFENCAKEIQNIQILLEDFLKIKTNNEAKQSRTNNVESLQSYHDILQAINFYMPNVQGIQLGIQYIEANIEFYEKNYIKSNKLLWTLYENANKTNYNLFIPYILISMALNNLKLQNKKQAKIFFNLAEQNITDDRKVLKIYMNKLKQKKEFQFENVDYDIVFDLDNHNIIEKEKGCIEFKNQFVLVNLLKLFLQNPGVCYSKKNLVKKIWNQEYLPKSHDNKIYVTIKRLRELVEVNSNKPKYICYSSLGYHVPKTIKTLIKFQENQNV